MLYISKDGEIINTEPGNEYFRKVLKLYDEWNSEKEIFELQTSGSTGTPKKIELSRKQIVASIDLTKNALNLDASCLFFCCLNVEYIAGMMMAFRAFHIGGELLAVEPGSNPFSDLKNQEYLLTDNRGRNFFAFVPLQMEELLKTENSISILKTAKAIIVGGAALNKSLKEKIIENNLPVFETYGMTETVSHIALKNILKEKESFEILEGVEIRKSIDQCLEIKSPTTNNEWIKTNDVIELIGKKRFILKGRLDNVINSGGIKIQLEEIERKIAANFDLHSRFFCFGIPDEKLGQKLVLVVEGKEIAFGKTELSAILTKFEVPKEIFLIEKFIETATAKVDKTKTIHEFLGH